MTPGFDIGDVRIRPACSEDRASLHSLLTCSWLRFWAPHLPQEAVERFRTQDPVTGFVDAHLARPDVAVIGPRLVGVVLVDGGCLEDLHVAHDARGRGVGRLLFERAVTLGARRLEVRAFNHHATGFYERMGWLPRDSFEATEMGACVLTHEYTAPGALAWPVGA